MFEYSPHHTFLNYSCLYFKRNMNIIRFVPRVSNYFHQQGDLIRAQDLEELRLIKRQTEVFSIS